ncbi:MAG: alpha/beta hydrolase [Prevotellaceae bacterium]|nr:alpha/beta hydrolase [Prevotellaceae bacterium]
MKKACLLFSFLFIVLLANAQNIAGSWNGKLSVGAMQLTMVFHITEADNKYSCTMDSPDQGAFGIPAEITVADNSVNINVPSIGFAYNGELKDNVLSGKITQNGYSFPLELKPGDVVINRPQTPKEPFPYATEEVTFNNKGNAVLSGTLTLPVDFKESKKSDVPLVIMVTGSGQQNRDEELFGHKPFLVLADYLARNGIASLRYDDRGTGKSTGDVESCTTVDFKEDALSAVEYVRKSGRFGKIGVLGHSEGGCIAFMIAADKKADFIISMAGTAQRGDSVLIGQNRYMLESTGTPAIYTSSYIYALDKVFNYVESGKSLDNPDGIVADILKNSPGMTLPQMKENLVEVIKTVNPWLKHFLSYDPTESISATKCPVMAINGSLDRQVSPAKNLEAIRKSLPDNRKNMIKEYPNLNHLFQHCTTGSVMEYGKIEETISPEVLKDIAEWINGLDK